MRPRAHMAIGERGHLADQVAAPAPQAGQRLEGRPETGVGGLAEPPGPPDRSAPPRTTSPRTAQAAAIAASAARSSITRAWVTATQTGQFAGCWASR